MGSEPFHYQLDRGDDRVCVMLSGMLEGASLPGLGADVQTLLDQLPAGAEILVDLTGVRRCDSAACRALARIQRKIKAHQHRTAWLANRPRIRGAAWWIVHAAQDPRAMPVTDRRFADDWLAGDQERLDQIEARTIGALERAEAAYGQRPGGRP